MQDIKMRVVGGKYIRRPIIYSLDHKEIRPTKDVVKQGIFNALGVDVKNRIALDLFAGTGALGIEALSRGAKSATFVDKNQESIRLIEQNTTYVEEDILVIKSDFENFIKKAPDFKYDLIFLDPPYMLDVVTVLDQLQNANLLADNVIIVLESDKPLDIKHSFQKVRTYKYGITYITILWRII